jgi:hypothetical protein
MLNGLKRVLVSMYCIRKKLNLETEQNKTDEQRKYWINYTERMIDEMMHILAAETRRMFERTE